MVTVFGRHSELAAIDRFLDRVPGGLSGLVVAGEPGIGKTTLWSAGVEAARCLDYQVLTARSAHSESSFAFAGLTDLLEPAADLLPELPPPQRRALEVALLRADEEGGHPVDHRTISVAALSVVRRLAEQRPVLLAVDDAQWLDVPSLQVLQFVLRRVGSSPVGLLVSMRTKEGRSPSAVVADMPQDRVQILEIGPLTPRAVEALLTEQLSLDLTRPMAARIHQASGGNPFYALEIGRAVDGRIDEYMSGSPLPLTDDLRDLVRDRVASLSPPGRTALAAVASTFQPTEELISSALGAEGGAGLENARRAGTIEVDGVRLRPSHPLVGATAYMEHSEEERRRLHASLAGAVEEIEEKARHLALAATGPDEKVAAALEAATASAARRGAPNAAAELAEQARRLTDPAAEADLHRRTALAGYHHIRGANLPRAKELLEEVVRSAPAGAARANSMRLLGEVAYLMGKTNEALALFSRALEEAHDAPCVAAHLEMNLSSGTFLLTDYPTSQRHSHAGLEQATRCGDPWLISQAQGVVVFNDAIVGEGVNEDLLSRSLELEDWDAPTMIWMGPTFVAPMVWAWAGRIPEATDGFDRLMSNMVERGQEATICLLGLYATRMSCWLGQLDSAQNYALLGRTASEHSGWAAGKAFASAAEAMVCCLTGDAELARTKVQEAAAILGDQSKFRTLCMMSSLGSLELSLGDFGATDRVLAPLVEFITTSGVGEPAIAAFAPDECEALIALGRLEEAQFLLDWLARRGQALDRPWALAAAARCRALLLAGQGRIGESMDQIDEALLQHKRLPMPIELGRTLLVKGRLHRRSREKSAAKEALEEAKALFESAGAGAWAAAAQSELDRIGLRPRAPHQLTPTEASVAQLAAAGLSTKEIAARAFLSPKSVEGVLTRVYRKLQVRSRSQLAAMLARKTDPNSGAE
ncbi:MAG TPA: AAA family ATPase [Actinomycetota bacterium]|nr:AAA family ATPase [Actinomycetota bacterium]